MAASVDNRIVSMEFDNAQFERNVATSMASLKKLDESMQFKNAENAFSDLEKASNNVKLSSISDALDKLNSHFSVWGIASRKIIEDITGLAEKAAKKMYDVTIGQISQGGWTRASNIEQAKFQLQGLGIAWDEVSDSINYAVDGTAYGLDSAAKAASQLAASGVELGQDMSDALRGISGVAAMTNSSYDEIANIFTTVAGNGRLMTMQLNQIGARGINAAAELAKAFGVTEGELRGMVTKGQIDFNSFAKAMDDAFGEHAKDANKTFTGVMSNIRAALSRIGAEFATPILTNMVGPLNQLKDMIVNVKNAMQPLFDIWQYFMADAEQFLVVLGDGINQSNIIPNIVTTLINLFSALLNVLIPIGEGIAAAFPEFTIKNIEEFTEKIKNFAEGLVLSEENEENLRNTSEGLFSILGIVKDVIGEILYILSPLTKLIEPIATAILNVTGTLGEWIVQIREYIAQSEVFQAAVQFAHDAVDYFATNLPVMIDSAFQFIGPIIEGICDLFSTLAEAIGIDLSQINIDFNNFKITDVLDASFNILQQIISGFLQFLGFSKDDIDNFFNNFKFPTFEEAVEFIKGLFTDFQTTISNVVSGIRQDGEKTGSIFDLIGEYLNTGKDRISAFISFLTEHVSIDQIASIGIVVFLAMFAKKIFDFISSIKKAATDILSPGLNLKNQIESIIGGISDVISSTKDVIKAETMMKMAEAIAILVGSLFVLSTIPTDKLVFATGSLGLVAFGVVRFMDEITKITKDIQSTQLAAIAAEIIAIGAAMLLLSAGVSILGQLKLEELAKGLGGIGVLLLEMYGFMKLIEKVEPTSMVGLIAMSVALDLLLPVIVVFSKFKPETLLKVELALAGLLAILLVFSNALSGNGLNLAVTAAGLIELAIAIDLLTPPLLVFALLPIEKLKQGIGALGLLGAGLLVFINLGSSPTLPLTAAGLIGLAVAIDLLTLPIIAFSLIGFETIAGGVGALCIALLGLGGTTAVLGLFAPLITAGAIAIGLLSAAVLAAGVGVLAFSVGLTGLIAAFALLGTTVNLVGPQFSKNITDMIVGIAKGIADAATDTAKAFLDMVMSWLNVISENAHAIVDKVVEVIGNIVTALIENIPKILNGIKETIVKAANYIVEHKEEILESAKKMFEGFVEGVKSLAGKAVDAIKEILEKIVEKITGFVGNIKDAASNLITGFIDGITGKKKDIIDVGSDIGEGLVEGMDNKVDDINDKAEELGETALDGVAEGANIGSPPQDTIDDGEDIGEGEVIGMDNKLDDVEAKAKELGLTAIDSLSDASTGSLAIGGGVGDKYIEGALKKVNDIKETGGTLGTTLSTGLDNVNISGVFGDEGEASANNYVDGIDKSLPDVEDAGESIGYTAVEALTGYADGKDISGSGRQLGENFDSGIASTESGLKVTCAGLGGMLEAYGWDGVAGAAAAGNAQGTAYYNGVKRGKDAADQLLNKTSGGSTDPNTIVTVDGKKIKVNNRYNQIQAKKSGISNLADLRKQELRDVEDYKAAVEEKNKALDALTSPGDGGGGSGGSGGGGGSSGASKTTQEVKELFDVLKDGAGVITAFDNRFVKLNETLDETSDEAAENTQSFEVAKGAVSALAEQLFVASDSYDETMAAMDKSSAEYLAGMKEAWDAYKESLESTLVGSVDAFSAFTQASHVSAEDILDNIYSEITGLEMFDETIRGLANSNINPTLLKDLVDGGIQNMDKLMGLLYATDQQRESISKAYETLTNVEANLTDKVMASLALSVDSYDKSIQETLANSEVFQEGMEKLSDNTQFTTSQIVVMFNETQQGLKEVIKSGMSYFDEYEKKQKVSKKELQKNLDDQKKAWEDWGDALNEVIAKGLDKSVVQNLMQMGVESMDKLQGFMDMTEDEIGHYNETVAEYIKIPDKLSAEIAANYTATALDVSNAFKDGIDSTKAEEAIAEMGNNLEQALKDAVGDKGSVQGSALSKSFDDGFKENAIYVYDTIKEFGQNVLDELEIDEGGIADIGENLMKSLAASIKDNSYLVVDALEEVTEEGKDTSEKGFGIGSPSKVFMDIGKFIDQGLAIGIRDNANDVTKQTKNLGNETYKAMDAVVGHILDILEGNEAFSPVITPVLDLDDVTNGMKDIRSMTGNFGVGYSFMQAQNAVNTVPTTQAGAYYNAPITINVYGNDDPDAVANAVQNKINHQIRRLGALG